MKKNFQLDKLKNLLKFLKKNKQKKNNQKDINILDLENSLSNKIGINVLIKNDKRNKGSITFFYKEISQLNKIIEIIKQNY